MSIRKSIRMSKQPWSRSHGPDRYRPYVTDNTDTSENGWMKKLRFRLDFALDTFLHGERLKHRHHPETTGTHW